MCVLSLRTVLCHFLTLEGPVLKCAFSRIIFYKSHSAGIRTFTIRMMRLLLVTLLLRMAAAGNQRFCCTPVQWESFNYVLRNDVYNTTSITVMTTQRLSIDGNGHLIAATANMTVDRTNVTIRTIQDFHNARSYIIRGTTCQVHTLPAWQPTCIPDDAQLIVSTYYGVGNNKVDVNTYGFPVGREALYLTVSRRDCLPLFGAIFGIQGIDATMGMKIYSNITLGIQDPSVFVVPDFCHGQPIALHPAPEDTGIIW